MSDWEQKIAHTGQEAISPPSSGPSPYPGYPVNQAAASAQPPFYPPFPAQGFSGPPVYKPQGTVSKTVFALSLVLAITLTACFTLGLAYAFNIDQTSNSGNQVTGFPDSKAEISVQEDIVLDGLSIRVDPDAKQEVKENAKKLSQLLAAIKDNYFRELSTAELLEAMIAGVPSNLGSPYSYYMTAEDFASMQQSQSGHYSGIGARITQNSQGAFELIDISPKSPAADGGLKPGDIIMAVGDTKAEQFINTTALANEVKGPEDTKVTLTVYRPSEARSFDVELTRRSIETIYVSHKLLDKNIGYLAISEFSSNLPEQFEPAIKDLVDQGAKSIIFDLRNNPGGDAYAVQQVLDMLLPKGTVASVKGRDNGAHFEEIWESTDGELVPPEMKFAILVNKNSASASELFSGALRDRLNTPIIGEQTFGKGSGTRFYTLEDGSAVNVTIFLYYFPNGDTPEGSGISPDKEVKLPDSAIGKVIGQLTPEEDTQLTEAIKEVSK